MQREFTKGLPGFRHLSYSNRLLNSKLESLEFRRHYDLIMTCKVLTGLVDVDANEFFSSVNCLKLLGQQCRVNTCKFFFTERVIEPWNSLLATAQDFSSLSKFKTYLKKVNFSKFVLTTYLLVTIFCVVRPLLQCDATQCNLSIPRHRCSCRCYIPCYLDCIICS